MSILAEMIGVKYGKVDEREASTTAGSARSLRWTPRHATEATLSGAT